MKRFFIGAVVASTVLAVAGCSASREEIYWYALDIGVQIAGDYEPLPQDPRCTDGSITDPAQRILACSGWDAPSQGWIREQCGERMPDGVADRSTWMEGCADGANDSPKYEVFGKHP
ncbi:hypothetical protein [Streptomyces sp. NBC_00996]|uniref:hypothetical protein n=1 Tax=Streptomyces sp. NBC_00996 TaxID=2903710 RepID=UPI00386F15DD|nr:hypothetical protein OG390_41830 [Streptomyces sp. NBC_00996]